MLRIAITKGRMFDEASELFSKAGYEVPSLIRKSRKLVVTDQAGRTWMLVRAQDVEAYVSNGAADIGIVGRDILSELDSDVYQMLDLGIARCKVVLAAEDKGLLSKGGVITIASKYPKITRTYFMKKGLACSVIKLYGSVELAPLVGLADGIVDLTETGETLKDNGLTILDEISESSAMLIVNRASLKMEKKEIDDLLAALEGVVDRPANSGPEK